MYQPSTNSVSAEQYEEVCTATVSYDSLSIISDTNLSLITPSQTATGIVIVIVIVIFYFSLSSPKMGYSGVPDLRALWNRRVLPLLPPCRSYLRLSIM